MKELRCPNCNSFDIDYVSGIFICKSCGGKYIPDDNEKPRKSEEDKLVDRLLKKWRKRDRYEEDYSDRNIERWLECTDDIDMIIYEILEINDHNPYAWAIRMLRDIEDGLKTKMDADIVVSDAEKALSYASDENIRGFIDVVKMNFSIYRDKLVGLDPGLEERVVAVEEKIKEWEERTWRHS